MTRHEQHETRLLRARRAAQASTHLHHVSFCDNDPLPYTDPAMHHHMSDSRRHFQDAFSFSREFPADPAVKVRPSSKMQIVLTFTPSHRTSSLDSKTISSLVCYRNPLMEMKSLFLMQTAIPFASLTIEFTQPRSYASTTLLTMYDVIKIL